jgi:hypothetical protein
MSTTKRAVVVAIAATAMALGLAAPANAGPGDDPCPLAMAFLCRMLPVAPDLDHDIDLTQESATVNGDVLPQMPGGPVDTESGPPASP